MLNLGADDEWLESKTFGWWFGLFLWAHGRMNAPSSRALQSCNQHEEELSFYNHFYLYTIAVPVSQLPIYKSQMSAPPLSFSNILEHMQ